MSVIELRRGPIMKQKFSIPVLFLAAIIPSLSSCSVNLGDYSPESVRDSRIALSHMEKDNEMHCVLLSGENDRQVILSLYEDNMRSVTYKIAQVAFHFHSQRSLLCLV